MTFNLKNTKPVTGDVAGVYFVKNHDTPADNGIYVINVNGQAPIRMANAVNMDDYITSAIIAQTYASKNNPVFTGNVNVSSGELQLDDAIIEGNNGKIQLPTNSNLVTSPIQSDNSTAIATTAFVQAQKNNLNGTNYLMVYGTGTPTENAEELQAAYEEAKKMPRYLGTPSTAPNMNYYKGQTFKHPYAATYHKFIVDALNTSVLTDSSKFELVPTEAEAKSTRTTVVIAPGEYKFGTTAFIVNEPGINIVSLTGNSDVIISSTEENSEYNYTYGIKVTAEFILIKGINCKTNTFYIESNLDNFVCEYCIGGKRSFGSNIDGTTSGTFNYCIAGNGSFGAYGTASGTFNYCTSGDSSFGGYGIAEGTFNNCIANLSSFGAYGTASGTFINCKLTSGTFPTPSGAGRIYNCIDGNDVLVNSESVKILNPTYNVYSGIFSQSSTEAPTWQYVESTIGNIVWTRDGSASGRYIGTLAGAFVDKQVYCLQQGIKIYGNSNVGEYINVYKEVDNTIILETNDNIGDTNDGLFPTGVFVEIRIY